MTLNDVLTDFAWLSILLLIGFQLRRKIKVLQRFFIPTSLIAGFLGMFFGPNWLGTVSPIYIPFTSALSQWSGVLVIFVCATMFLGLELGSVTRNGMAATFMGGLSHQVQLVTGLIVAAICGLFMSDLPYQFGFMGVWGFYAGHGNATTVGNIMQEAGFWDDAVGVGVTFATLGMLSGVIGGMILINIGAKKGLTHVKMSFDDMPEDERTGYIKPEDRRSIGNGVTNSSSIDPLAFQLAVIGLVVVIGILERTLLIKIHPVMSNFPLVGAVLVSSMIVGFLINKSHFKNYIDRKCINRLTSTALDYMITAAIATTSMEIFTTYAVPLVITAVLIVAGNIFVCYIIGRWWVQDTCWFEIGTGMYGHLCGNLATGLMLIRVMDPTQETNASQSVSTSATLGYAWQIPYMIIGSLTIFTAPTATTVVSVALLLFFLIGGSILFGRKQKTA